MKIIKHIAALILCSNLFISCTNNESDEEMQTLIDIRKISYDSDIGENPPPPPDDPDIED